MSRVLRFPSRSLGTIAVRDGRLSAWKTRGLARGSVVIADGFEARLDVATSGVTALEALRRLAGDDLQGVNFTWSEVTDDHLVHLNSLTGLEGLDLGDTGPELATGLISDQGVSKLAPLTKLRGLALRKSRVRGASLNDLTCRSLAWLDLSETFVSDAAMPSLAQFPELTGLSLRRTAITDCACEYVGTLSKLHRLDVSDTAIGDPFLACLGSAFALEWLNLSATRITDAGLATLSQRRSLRKLDIWQCAVSDDAVRALQRTLPGCAIAF